MHSSISLHSQHSNLPTNHLSPSLRSATNPKLISTELKFLIPTAQREQVVAYANAVMELDPYCVERNGYQVESLYLDTPGRDVLFRTPTFRGSKYRIRRYDDNVNVFLEHKSKSAGHLTKRRILYPLSQLGSLDDAGWETPSDTDNWFRSDVQRLQLRPACQVQYRRIAYFLDAEPAPLRLTIDSRLSSNACESHLFSEQLWHGVGGNTVGDGAAKSASDCSVRTFESVDDPMRFILSSQMILELKFVDSMPTVFKKMLAELRLEPVRISKYRTAMVPIFCVSESED